MVPSMHTNDLAEFIRSKEIPASDLVIYKEHKEIFRFTCGYKDSEKTVPMKGDELYNLYSATKVITCTGALRLVERGIIGIDDPVSKYIPEFGQLTYRSDDGIKPCSKVMTVRQLFAMRGGLSYDLNSPSIKAVLSDPASDKGTLSIVRAIAKEPLLFEPGTNFNYSLCHDVLGAVIEIASGKRLGKYLSDNIFAPLGMSDTGFFPTKGQEARFTDQYRLENNEYRKISLHNSHRLSDNYESGGAGVFSCIEDYVKLTDALANHGTAYNGYQLLRPETVELMRSNQNDREALIKLGKPGYGYAFGVRTMLDKDKQNSDAQTDCEFGWDGAAGTYTAIDPANRLTVVYTQHVLGHGWVYSDVHPVIRDTMYYIAGICK